MVLKYNIIMLSEALAAVVLEPQNGTYTTSIETEGSKEKHYGRIYCASLRQMRPHAGNTTPLTKL